MKNKYFDNEVCDRLCEAGILAGNNGVNIFVDGLGLEVSKVIEKRPSSRKDFKKRVSFLDLSEARINILCLVVQECIEHCG